LIEGAASGEDRDRIEFVRRYGDVAKAYLRKRWGASPLIQDLDDAVQEIYVECFRENGALSRANPARSGGFRAFYFGVIRNVARRHESQTRRRNRNALSDFDFERLPSGEDGLAEAFDRAWAKAIMRQAGEVLQKQALTSGEAAEERVELLRLRFYQDKPIREIAALWNEDPARLHHEYARARREFEAALFDVVGWHHRGTPAAIREECVRLLSLLA
jgi:RNA polymerase sigma-70 factor (ECF subfamily)